MTANQSTTQKKPFIQAELKKHTLPSQFVTEKGNPFKILSNPRKMPCPSFSLPAGKSCPNAVYGENAICSSCYACKGRYTLPNVKAPRSARFDWTRESLKSEAGREQWVETIVSAIRATGTQYFRGHDSGDFFSPAYVQMWIEVCLQLPEVKFWFPTRSWQDGKGSLNERMLKGLRTLAALPNVVIRPSALYFGDSAPQVAGLNAGSTAAADDATHTACVAPKQGGYCGSCRTCWDKSIPVTYKKH
jgi:hypothetical protein